MQRVTKIILLRKSFSTFIKDLKSLDYEVIYQKFVNLAWKDVTESVSLFHYSSLSVSYVLYGTWVILLHKEVYPSWEYNPITLGPLNWKLAVLKLNCFHFSHRCSFFPQKLCICYNYPTGIIINEESGLYERGFWRKLCWYNWWHKLPEGDRRAEPDALQLGKFVSVDNLLSN